MASTKDMMISLGFLVVFSAFFPERLVGERQADWGGFVNIPTSSRHHSGVVPALSRDAAVFSSLVPLWEKVAAEGCRMRGIYPRIRHPRRHTPHPSAMLRIAATPVSYIHLTLP